MPSSALVLTAGLGTRLRPLTYARAKAAVPVAGEPIVTRILRWLAGQGVCDVVLNLHYKPATITRIVGDGSGFGVRVRYSWEPRLLGTAGGPRRALSLLDADRFLVVNGDTLTDLDLTILAAEHQRRDALVTLAVIPNPDPDRYGGVRADEEGRVQGYVPAGRGPGDHFIGVQMVQGDAFRSLPEAEPRDLLSDVHTLLLARHPGAVRVARTAASFHDTGTPADYLATTLAYGAQQEKSVWTGTGCQVHPSAELTRTILWDDVHIGARTRLTDCIVTDGVRVPPDSRYERCVILAAASVPADASGTRAGNLLIASLEARSPPRMAPRATQATP